MGISAIRCIKTYGDHLYLSFIANKNEVPRKHKYRKIFCYEAFWCKHHSRYGYYIRKR